MKCSNPECDHGIGLVSYRRAFSKRRFCSKTCRDSHVIETAKIERAEPATPGGAPTYLAWLFPQSVGNSLQQMPATVARTRSR